MEDLGNRGRPSLTSPHTIISEINKISPPSFLPPDSVDSRPSYTLSQSIGLKTEDVECNICTQILDQPVQLPCSSVVCRGCICRSVNTKYACTCDLTQKSHSPVFTFRFNDLRWFESHDIHGCPMCPCCYGEHPWSIQSPSNLLMRVLGRVLVECPACHRSVHYEDYQSHIGSGCKDQIKSSSDMLVSDILSQPLTIPTTGTEQRLASNLVRRMLRSSDHASVHISTGGQVRDTHWGCALIRKLNLFYFIYLFYFINK